MPYNDFYYNEVKFKASHNSYNRDEHIIDQLQWQHNHNNGCRGIELDISQSDDGKHFSVAHKFWYDNDAPDLSQYLNHLRVWSKDNPKHDCITVHLDLKKVNPNFIEQLDLYLEKHFDIGTDTSLFSPKHLIQQYPNLATGLTKHGWPTLGELRGKFIFCLSGLEEHKAKYAATLPSERYCFADYGIKNNSTPTLDHRVFLNCKKPFFTLQNWRKAFHKTKQHLPYSIIRVYGINSQSYWNQSLVNKSNILSTDKVSDHDWAKVGNFPFYKHG